MKIIEFNCDKSINNSGMDAKDMAKLLREKMSKIKSGLCLSLIIHGIDNRIILTERMNYDTVLLYVQSAAMDRIKGIAGLFEEWEKK